MSCGGTSLEGARGTPWESRPFVPGGALSPLLTGVLQPLLSFGLNIQGLEGVEITSYPCISAHLKLEVPWKRDGKYSYPPPLQHLPLLGAPGAAALQEGAGQHHRLGSDGSCSLRLIALCRWWRGEAWGLQQWLENRLWKERLTC